MRRPGGAAGASQSVSWVVSPRAGELAEPTLHGLELASHPLLLRAKRAERAAGIGERRDGRRALAEGNDLGHELAYLGLVTGRAALVAATGRERVVVERGARSARGRHGVGGGQESAGALRQGVRERRQRLAREPVLVPRGAHAREPGGEELDERAVVGVEGPVRDELAGGREVAKGEHREPLWGREQRVAAPRGEGPEPLADTVEVDRARGEPADEPDH